jgi:glycosyltransferase involved in cell wall biosynthesis
MRPEGTRSLTPLLTRLPREITFVIDGELDQPTGGYLYDRIVIDGLRERGAEVRIEGLAAGGALSALRENARLATQLARRPWDGVVVIDELCHPRAVLAAALHRRRPRARLVALVHHLAANERAGLRRRARLAVERVLLDAADLVIVTSWTTRTVVARAGVDAARIEVIQPGCDRLGEREGPPAPAPDGHPRLLFLGSITPRKGVLELIGAFSAAPGHATLTLAGADDRDHRYVARVRDVIARSSAKDRIRLTGTLDDAAISSALDQHDLLVLPSRYEGYGIALAEAVAHGLGVISTTAGAIPEVVRDGAEAILVPPGDERALAEAITRAVSDPCRRAEMQAQAIARARALPRWSETQRAFAEAIAGA